MRYLLDTNPCVVYLRGRNLLLRQRVSGHPAADVTICTIVLAELYFGTFRSRHPARERAAVGAFVAPYTCLPFDEAAAEVYAAIRHDLESRGLPIGENDYLIAAIALAHNLTLVTHNTAEFSRVPGLVLEDWEIP